MTTATATTPPRPGFKLDSLTQRYLFLILLIVIASVGFGIAITRFRLRGSVEVEEARELKG